MASRPQKILYAVDAMARGGTELQLIGMIDRLDRERFSPVLLTLRPSPAELAPLECEILAWDVPKLFGPAGWRSCRDLSNWLKANEVDIVHTFFQDATVFAGVAARIAKVPVRIAGFRDLGFWRTRSQVTLMRMVYPCFTGFVANSFAVKEHFCEKDKLRPERVHVIPNGIDSERLMWNEHVGPVKDVVVVGNLNRRVKRIDLFIRAAGLLQSDFPDVQWHVCGDGELREELEMLAKDVGVSKMMKFHGREKNITRLLEQMQVGVNCSDSEGFSNAVLEYMLKGCAVVATNVGGNSEIINSGETGVLVTADNALDLATGLRSLLSDSTLRRRIAATAREVAEKKYGWQRCIAAHEKVYSEAMTNFSGGS